MRTDQMTTKEIILNALYMAVLVACVICGAAIDILGGLQ